MKTKKRFVLCAALVTILSSAHGQTFLTNGLVGYYPFNGNANDSSGSGSNGIVSGAVLAPDRFGVANQAYYFNGTNSYIQIPSSTNEFGSQDFTVAIWFNSLKLPNVSIPAQAACFLISKGQNNFELATGSATSATGMQFLPRTAGGGQWNTPASTYQTNVWQHVVAVYKPSTTNVMVFMNGVGLPLTGPSSTPVGTNNSTPARLGMRADGTLPFRGYVDSIRIYNRALSTNEVQQLYQFEAPKADIAGVERALRLDCTNLVVGGVYQIQASANLTIWTNYGASFTASSTNVSAYVDVGWSNSFFRLNRQ